MYRGCIKTQNQTASVWMGASASAETCGYKGIEDEHKLTETIESLFLGPV